MLYVHLRRMYVLLFLDRLLFIYLLSLPAITCHLRPMSPYSFSVWMSYPLVQWSIKSFIIIVLLSLYWPSSHTLICHLCVCSGEVSVKIFGPVFSNVACFLVKFLSGLCIFWKIVQKICLPHIFSFQSVACLRILSTWSFTE